MDIEKVKAQVVKYAAMVQSMQEHGITEIEYGRRFAKISASGHVHTFIDLTNGDILKAATYKAPAKNGVRGNIFAADLGRDRVNHFGANYLR